MENRNQNLRKLFHLPLICSAALLSFGGISLGYLAIGGLAWGYGAIGGISRVIPAIFSARRCTIRSWSVGE